MTATIPPRIFRTSVLFFGMTAALFCVGAYLLAQNLGRWLRNDAAAAAAPRRSMSATA